jgi:hypothetical protein
MENPTCLGRQGLFKYFPEGAEEASKTPGDSQRLDRDSDWEQRKRITDHYTTKLERLNYRPVIPLAAALSAV